MDVIFFLLQSNSCDFSRCSDFFFSRFFFLRLIMDDDKQALAIGLGAGLGGFAGLVRI